MLFMKFINISLKKIPIILYFDGNRIETEIGPFTYEKFNDLSTEFDGANMDSILMSSDPAIVSKLMFIMMTGKGRDGIDRVKFSTDDEEELDLSIQDKIYMILAKSSVKEGRDNIVSFKEAILESYKYSMPDQEKKSPE